MNSPLFIAFGVVVNFATWLIFIRFLLQFAGIDKKHPYVAPAYQLTKVVDIFARIFPTLKQGRISLAAIVLLLLLSLIELAGISALLNKPLTAIELFFAGTVGAVIAFLDALRWLILISVVLSFIVMLSNKIHPIVEIVLEMADPIIEPFRKITPNLGMLDLSPLIAMLALGLASRVIEIVAQELLLM